MISPALAFSTDPGKILDFTGRRPADIFNEVIAPRVNQFDPADEAGLDEARQRREGQLQQDLSRDAFTDQSDDDFLSQVRERQQQEPTQDLGDYASPPTDYDSPLPSAPTGDEKLKLSNYGYSSDSSPDHNSNVLRIGHANNKLVDGYSAALTKSLAKRYGLKTGDEFEVMTSDGKKLVRRYDDTVPTKYKGKPLPETVDLYELNGSNKFGGTVVGIRPLKSQ